MHTDTGAVLSYPETVQRATRAERLVAAVRKTGNDGVRDQITARRSKTSAEREQAERAARRERAEAAVRRINAL